MTHFVFVKLFKPQRPIFLWSVLTKLVLSLANKIVGKSRKTKLQKDSFSLSFFLLCHADMTQSSHRFQIAAFVRLRNVSIFGCQGCIQMELQMKHLHFSHQTPNQTVCKPLYNIAIVSELKRFILKSHFIVSLFEGTQWLPKVSKLKIPSFNNLHQMMTRLESLGNRLFANNWNHCFLLPIIRNATEKMPDCNLSKLPRTETYKCSIKNNIVL